MAYNINDRVGTQDGCGILIEKSKKWFVVRLDDGTEKLYDKLTDCIELKKTMTSITGKTTFSKGEKFSLGGKETADKILLHSESKNRKYWLNKSDFRKNIK